jgi:N-hydroxyarylamine O-acetyltransferase
MSANYRLQLVPEQWRAWRQRLRGDQGDLLEVFGQLTLPRNRSSKETDLRVARAAALCDAALYMLWLAGLAPRDAGRRLQQRQVNLIDLRPADVVTFVGSLAANGATDEELAEVTRHEFDQCWHEEAKFRKDLMAYLFRPDVYLERAFDAQEGIRDLLPAMDDFSEFVVAAASREMRSATGDPLVALGSLVTASLPRDEQIQGLVAVINQRSRTSWTKVYGEALSRYGRRLNDGLTVGDFTRMAAMLTEGALAHSRSDPAETTSADMLAGIQLMVNAFVARTETVTRGNVAMADAKTLGRYRRRLLLSEDLNPDEKTLRRLQAAHLDGFAYSNLDLMLGETFFDLQYFLNRLMNSGHGGLCYQLNYSLALVLRAVGFDTAYLWGTVSKKRGEPGTPGGNHLGLLVTLDEDQWLVDAGLGDGPREPIRLIPGGIQQGPFHYELIEDPDTWTLLHDKRGTFAEVIFSKEPVAMDKFRRPAKEQATDHDSSWMNTLAVMKRREDEVHLLRGRVYEVIGTSCPLTCTVESPEEWLRLLASQFGLYLGNVSASQKSRVWQKICDTHERWAQEHEQ